MMTRLRRLDTRALAAARRLLSSGGSGIGGDVPTSPGFGSRSWGGCAERIPASQLTYIATGDRHHVCAGHSTDQRSWQHRCACGFRWAAQGKVPS